MKIVHVGNRTLGTFSGTAAGVPNARYAPRTSADLSLSWVLSKSVRLTVRRQQHLRSWPEATAPADPGGGALRSSSTIAAHPGGSMQRRVALAVGTVALAAPIVALAQAAQRSVRIGILFGDAPMPHEEVALREGLRELGYVEGRNLVIERRYAEGRVQLVPGYARELASMKLDAVVSTCTPTTRMALQALGSTPGSTPIIMAAVADPVGQQLIASLARPGANVTGLASQAEDIMPKMLELFTSVMPRPTTVAVLADSGSAVHPRMWQALGPIAQRLNVQLVKVDAGRRPSDGTLPAAFDAAIAQRATGILVLPDEPFFVARRGEIVALAARHRLPAFYGLREYVDEGGLMSYGESMYTAYRGLAPYIGKIAAGAKPGELPVSQPTQFELVVNLKTAKALGIVLPQAVVLSANAVIQ